MTEAEKLVEEIARAIGSVFWYRPVSLVNNPDVAGSFFPHARAVMKIPAIRAALRSRPSEAREGALEEFANTKPNLETFDDAVAAAMIASVDAGKKIAAAVRAFRPTPAPGGRPTFATYDEAVAHSLARMATRPVPEELTAREVIQDVELTPPLPASAPAQGVPDGWKLVPVEPNDEMLAAAFKQANEQLLSELGNMHCKTDEERSAFAVRPLYRAMLAASPSPEDRQP